MRESERSSQRRSTAAVPTGRRRRRVRYGTALLALLTVVGYVTFRTLTGAPTECTAQANGERVALQPQQAANAATIGAVASSRRLPERALAIALTTALQESELRNLREGDRDSLGLFQQRPSQGWGTAQHIMDPVYSANEFFDELVKIPGYADLPPAVAAQQVQHSGYPQAYAKRVGAASVLASALSGRVPSLSCRVAPESGAGSVAAVQAQLTREFGPQVDPQQDMSDVSDAPGGSEGSVVLAAVTLPESAPRHKSKRKSRGKAGDKAGDEAKTAQGPDAQEMRERGWVLAQWAVAHAQDLRITEVSYAGRMWQASHSGEGWVEAPAANAHANAPTNAHANAAGHSGAPGQSYEDVRITVAR
jgi:hypothetical protein